MIRTRKKINAEDQATAADTKEKQTLQRKVVKTVTKIYKSQVASPPHWSVEGEGDNGAFSLLDPKNIQRFKDY